MDLMILEVFSNLNDSMILQSKNPNILHLILAASFFYVKLRKLGSYHYKICKPQISYLELCVDLCLSSKLTSLCSCYNCKELSRDLHPWRTILSRPPELPTALHCNRLALACSLLCSYHKEETTSVNHVSNSHWR